MGRAIVTYAEERKEERALAGIVTVRVANWLTTLNCIVGPPGSEPLLGQVVLETMDLLVERSQQKLVPRPELPYLPLLKLKRIGSASWCGCPGRIAVVFDKSPYGTVLTTEHGEN